MRNGLMQPPQPAEEGMAPEPMMAGPEPMEDDTPDEYFSGGEASPQEQKQYDRLMETFLGMLHSKETHQEVVAKLKSGADNVGAVIGDMALTIFMAVEDQVEKQGKQIGDSVKLEAGQDLILELVQIAVAAKLVPDDEEAVGVVTADAIDVMASRYGKNQKDKGRVDQQYATQHLEELKGMASQRFGQDPMAAGVQGANAEMAGGAV